MTVGATFALVIAVKRIGEAKTRLAPALSSTTRASLVLAMLADVVGEAIAVSAVESITVVTPDDVVATAAAGFGAHVLKDPTPAGHRDPLNNAIRAAEAAVCRGTSHVGVLHGDLPALRRSVLAEAISAARLHRRSFVSDRHGTGTVALFAQGVPLDPAFGVDSAGLHRSSGAVELCGSWAGLRCDIDTPDDMATVLRLGVGPSTGQVLDSTSGQPRSAVRNLRSRGAIIATDQSNGAGSGFSSPDVDIKRPSLAAHS